MGKMFGPTWDAGLGRQPYGPQNPPPSILFDFFYSLPAPFTFTRASNAWGFNAVGALTQAANDVSRQVYDPTTLVAQGTLLEPASSNRVRNPRCEGAIPGTPGTQPTNWLVTTPTGVTSSVVGTGTESGIPYVDIRWQGTVTAIGSGTRCQFETATGIAAATGQTWTASVFMRLMAGSVAGYFPQLTQIESTAAGGFVTAGSKNVAISNVPLNTQRNTYTRTLSGGATVACVSPQLFIAAIAIGNTIDFTIRFGLPQMEQQSYVSSPIMPPAGSPAVSTRAAESLSLVLPYGGFPGAVGWSAAMEFTPLAFGTGMTLLGVSALVPLDDQSFIGINDAGGTCGVVKTVGGSQMYTPFGASLMLNIPAKIALAQDAADARGSLNGGAIAVAANVGYPAMLTLTPAESQADSGAGTPLTLRRLQLWPRKLSDAELQAVTA